MSLVIKKAERKQRKFKACLVGISGSGKTWTSLELAKGLLNSTEKDNNNTSPMLLLIDSERASSSIYADEFDFDIIDLPQGASVDNYLEGIKLAEKNGYKVLIIDSMSHAWEYLLEEVDKAQLREKGLNSFTAWKKITPIYKKLIQAIVDANLHVIATMRAKSDYVMEEYQGSDGKTRTKPVKVGLAPIFRTGGEYEFDLVANIDIEHNFIVEKTRISFLADYIVCKADYTLGEKIGEWLNSGAKIEIPKADVNPLDYKLECPQSKLRGQSLSQIEADTPGWLNEANTNEKRQAVLSERDKVNIQAAVKVLTHPKPQRKKK